MFYTDSSGIRKVDHKQVRSSWKSKWGGWTLYVSKSDPPTFWLVHLRKNSEGKREYRQVSADKAGRWLLEEGYKPEQSNVES